MGEGEQFWPAPCQLGGTTAQIFSRMDLVFWSMGFYVWG